jgi:hypothetical protein
MSWNPLSELRTLQKVAETVGLKPNAPTKNPAATPAGDRVEDKQEKDNNLTKMPTTPATGF